MDVNLGGSKFSHTTCNSSEDQSMPAFDWNFAQMKIILRTKNLMHKDAILKCDQSTPMLVEHQQVTASFEPTKQINVLVSKLFP